MVRLGRLPFQEAAFLFFYLVAIITIIVQNFNLDGLLDIP
ncbi:hypothetical protein C8N37_10656 [Sphingobacterium faecium]|nr:hypothetical protein C8N37_10656 [Sphingobacterium faecium]